MTSGGTASIWRRFCSVGGISTELLGISAISGCPRLQVVVFPGNPGSAAYFRPFMQQVHTQLGGAVDVLAVTHAGHDPETDHGGRLWDLAQQVDHKLAFLREHVLLRGRPPVVLVGHSIGATMMIKAVMALEREQERERELAGSAAAAVKAEADACPGPARDGSPFSTGSAAAAAGGAAWEGLPPIAKLVAVFPFFETNFAGSARQRRLRLLAPWYEALGWVGAAVTSLPWALQLAFVRLNAAMDMEAAALTAQLLSRRTVRNAFFLASHEFKDLSRPFDWPLLAALGTRLHVMGCEDDTWMDRQQFDQMRQQVPGLQATWHPDLRHAFCISERQSAAVAAAVAAVSRSLLPDLPADLGAAKGAGLEAPEAEAAQAGRCAAGLLWGSRAASASAISVSRASSSSGTLTTLTSTDTSTGASAGGAAPASSGADDVGAGGRPSAAGDGGADAHGAVCAGREPAATATVVRNDQDALPYGQRLQRPQHVLGGGDDVTPSAAAAAYGTFTAARGAGAGGGAYAGGDVDGADDQDDGAAAAAVVAAGLRCRRRQGFGDQAAGGYGSKAAHAPAVTDGPVPVAISASDESGGAGGGGTAGGVTNRGVARRQGARGMDAGGR